MDINNNVENKQQNNFSENKNNETKSIIAQANESITTENNQNQINLDNIKIDQTTQKEVKKIDFSSDSD
jgi:hypothetical protein